MTTPQTDETDMLLSGSPMKKKPSYSVHFLINDEPGSLRRIPLPPANELSFNTLVSEYVPQRKPTMVSPDAAPTKGESSFFFTCFNLGNDILGSSIISQPYFVAELGFWFAPFVYVLFAIVTSYTLNMLYYLCQTHNIDNYPKLCERALGRAGLFAACFCIFMFNWGGQVASILIIGTGIPSILQFITHSSSIWISREYVLMYCALLFWPLSFFKNISAYAINAFLSFLGLVGVAVIIAAKSLATHVHDHHGVNAHELSFFGRDPLPALGGLSFMFVCHDLSINVHQELRDRTPRRWAAVVAITLAAIMLVWWMVIAGGYFMFYDNCADNVLDMFAYDDVPIVVARALLCLTIIISIPYTLFMPRVSLYAMVRLVLGDRVDATVFHVIGTTVICMSCFIVALFVTNLGVLFELIGSISAVGLAYVLPPLCFLALEGGKWYHSPKKLLALAVLAFGLFCMIGGTGKIVLGLFNGTKK